VRHRTRVSSFISRPRLVASGDVRAEGALRLIRHIRSIRAPIVCGAARSGLASTTKGSSDASGPRGSAGSLPKHLTW